jgi:hypothetical protein
MTKTFATLAMRTALHAARKAAGRGRLRTMTTGTQPVTMALDIAHHAPIIWDRAYGRGRKPDPTR